MNKWYSLINIGRSASDEIVADFEVGPESPWFSGHFPGEPILPGVAQLEMVFDTIQGFSPKSLRVTSIRKVRFKQMIRPNDSIRIIAKPRDQRSVSFSFRVMAKGQLACSGIMVIEEPDQP